MGRVVKDEKQALQRPMTTVALHVVANTVEHIVLQNQIKSYTNFLNANQLHLFTFMGHGHVVSYSMWTEQFIPRSEGEDTRLTQE